MPLSQFDIEFDRQGRVFNTAQQDAIIAAVPHCSDIIVASHGWNNDMADAADLYNRLFQKIQEVLDAGLAPSVAGRTFAAVRIFWPSKRFTDEELIPGGGAASAAAGAANQASLLTLLERLKINPERLGDRSEDPIRVAAIERAKALVPQLETSDDARREFVLTLRTMLNPSEAHLEDASQEFFSRDPLAVFDAMSSPVNAPLPAGAGGAAAVGAGAGGAASLNDLLGGAVAAGRRLLNFTTYYEMKERAGVVGRIGGAPLVRRIRQAAPNARVHLVGHSFGGRLVTAIANELDPNTPHVSMTLLQAAYSHNGLAAKFDGTHDGAFRGIMSQKRISGPILITHTKNDRAVGIAYPLASRMAFQNAAAFGDQNDPYGGMGRNGAQHTAEAEGGELKSAGQSYAFSPGRIYNLRADSFIKDHSDIAGHEVAYALLVGTGAA